MGFLKVLFFHSLTELVLVVNHDAEKDWPTKSILLKAFDMVRIVSFCLIYSTFAFLRFTPNWQQHESLTKLRPCICTRDKWNRKGSFFQVSFVYLSYLLLAFFY